MSYSNKLAVFDASEVVMTFGPYAIEGLADGTFVEVVQQNDSFGDVAGADGEVVRTKSNDRRFEISFTTLQSSASNKALSDLHNADLAAQNGGGILPLTVFDKASGTTVFCAKAWLKRTSDVGYAKEQTDRVWALRTNNAVVNHEGNPAV